MEETPKPTEIEKHGKKRGDAITFSGFGLSMSIPTGPLTKLGSAVKGYIDLWIDADGVRARSEAVARRDVAVLDEREKLVRADGVLARKLHKIEGDALVEQTIEERAASRVSFQERRRQDNVEAVFVEAVKSLPSAGKVNDDPVHPDWMARCINYSQDVSDEYMRQVWGRILAGEVAKPGSFSPRTLAVVGTMTKADAELFTKFCSLVWHDDEEPILIAPMLSLPFGFSAPRPTLDYLPSFTETTHLEALGLISWYQAWGNVSVTPRPRPDGTRQLEYHGFRYVNAMEGPHEVRVGAVSLTSAGEELCRIAHLVPIEAYRLEMDAKLREQGYGLIEGSAR